MSCYYCTVSAIDVENPVSIRESRECREATLRRARNRGDNGEAVAVEGRAFVEVGVKGVRGVT